MNAKREAKRARREARAANIRAAKIAARQVPTAPSERDVDVAQLNALLSRTDNVKDVPLGLLRVHPVHGDRDPYKDSPEGLRRRQRCVGHIRASGGWNNAACEVLTACDGGDGFFDVINGVGRLYMADVLSGGLVDTLPVRILTKLTNAEVLKVFEIMGTQNTKISPYDLWRSKKDARTAEGAEVRDILGIKEAFGNKWPHVKLPVMQFGYSKGVLHRAVALVTNTALGTNQKLVNIMTSATIALFATNPKLDEARFRHVLPEGNDSLPGWLFDRAQAKANKLGYLKPHARVAAWLVAHIIADELYNPAFRGAKLDIDALATLKCDYYDAYSNAPPKAKRTKLRVVASAA